MKNTLVRYLALGCAMTAAALQAQTPFKIGGLETTTLTRIVPDKIIFAFPGGIDGYENWEPYASVLGTSTFLISANTFAVGSVDNQRFGVAFQPVAGGPNAEGDVLFADDGTPFRD